MSWWRASIAEGEDTSSTKLRLQDCGSGASHVHGAVGLSLTALDHLYEPSAPAEWLHIGSSALPYRQCGDAGHSLSGSSPSCEPFAVSRSNGGTRSTSRCAHGVSPRLNGSWAREPWLLHSTPVAELADLPFTVHCYSMFATSNPANVTEGSRMDVANGRWTQHSWGVLHMCGIVPRLLPSV
jgi:hypothetical protein